MSFYKYWRLLDELPNGWKICKAAGSPLHGYEFCTNSLSAIHPNHQRALVRVRQPQQQLRLDAPTISKVEAVADEPPKAERPYPARTVNELARERFKLQLLNDIRCDLIICELEGWGQMEYINEIRRLVNEIGNRVTIDA